MALITEEHMHTAKMFETICGTILAKVFIEQLENDSAMDTDKLKNVDNVKESLEFVRQFAENAEKHRKNTKLLNNIRDGKYRLLFAALAAGLEDAHHEIVKNINKEQLKGLIEEAFDLGKDK